MIGEDLSPYMRPVLFIHFDGPLPDGFLTSLLDRLDEWDEIKETHPIQEVQAELAAGEKTSIAVRDSDPEVTLSVLQSGTRGRENLSVLTANVDAHSVDGDRWFEFVVGLYERCVDAGERPINTLVTVDSGRYVVRPFTEESILADELFTIAWIHVFTPDQVDYLDRDKLLSAPATRIEQLDEDSVALGTTLGDGDQIEAVGEHLGVEPPVGEDWFDDLTHDIDFVRNRAARRIRSEASYGTVPAERIIEHLDTDDSSIRWTLTQALRHLKDEHVEEALFDLATTDEDEAVRSAAVGCLGTEEIARKALWDPSPRVQASGLDELNGCPDDAALNRIIELLDSEYYGARQKAAERIMDDWFVDELPGEVVKSARLTLANCDDHDDKVVRREAIEAAVQVQPDDLADRLEYALNDDWSGVKIATAKHYSDVPLDLDSAVGALLDVIDAGSFYAADAVELLVDIDPDIAIEELIPRLYTLESKAKRTTLDSLDDLVRTCSRVACMLHSIDEVDRKRAVETLRDESRGEHLQEAIEDSLE